ncbi:MAG TPA: hypothetical protein VK716_02680 [Terracidiphilus sp.]|jgi:hypothetical protein|nr:hypothetical protein [Terracidiphilus sp.]
MDSKRFSVFNKTRQTYLGDEIRIVDAVLEPLKVLKVLIEGLEPEVAEGLWLTHFKGVPVARTLSPFDLIYLDKDYRVVHSAELSTESDFAPFKGTPESALVFPPQTISSSGTRNGDQLVLRIAEQIGIEPARPAAPAMSAPVVTGARSLRDLSPGSRFSNISFPAPAAQPLSAPIDNFLTARQSASTQPRIADVPQEARPAEPQRNILTPIRTSPVPAAQPMPPRPLNQRSPVQPVPPAPRPPQSRVVKPAKRKAPIPIHPVPERAPAPATTPPPAQEFSPPPSIVSASHATSAPSQIVARSAPPILTAPAARPNTPTPAIKPDPTFFPPERRTPRGTPAPFSDYKDHVLPPPVNEQQPSRTIRFLRWLFPDLNIDRPKENPDRRRAMRLPTPDLVAYFFTGGAPVAHSLHDISVTGFYMQTDERWIPGTIIRMTLQRPSARGVEPGDALTVHSRVVRWGQDGGGFEFVLSGFLE